MFWWASSMAIPSPSGPATTSSQYAAGRGIREQCPPLQPSGELGLEVESDTERRVAEDVMTTRSRSTTPPATPPRRGCGSSQAIACETNYREVVLDATEGTPRPAL
jgi:hypothetical protein